MISGEDPKLAQRYEPHCATCMYSSAKHPANWILLSENSTVTLGAKHIAFSEVYPTKCMIAENNNSQ